MSFARPEILLWLFPWLVFCLIVLSYQRTRRRRLQEFLEEPSLLRLGQEARSGRRSAAFLLQSLALAWWIVAWAGPQWGSQKIKVERNALDIVFLGDCSKSMLAQDPPPNRRQVALRELTLLMEKFQDNRMGLVGFAGKAFVFCPLTLDAGATELFLEQLDENAIPAPGTAIGESLRVGLTIFPKNQASSKVMILLTDGEDHHSNPMDAAKEVARAGVTLYTVGIGSPEGAPIPASSTANDYIKDARGQTVISKLDDKLLKEMAVTCGGTYLRIQKPTDNLDPIVKSVLSKERRKLDSQMMVRRQPQFSIFIVAGLIFLAAGMILVPRVRA